MSTRSFALIATMLLAPALAAAQTPPRPVPKPVKPRAVTPSMAPAPTFVWPEWHLLPPHGTPPVLAPEIHDWVREMPLPAKAPVTWPEGHEFPIAAPAAPHYELWGTTPHAPLPAKAYGPGFHGEWYQDDPADSLYRAAYGLFSRQEYRQAATRFQDVRTRFPNTRYYCDAAYYEAFARYRLGTPTDLRTGYQVLDGIGDRCTQRARRADVPELAARINSALARLGDNAAAERLRRAAGEGQNVCDSEERNVKIEALTALAQMDPQNANPVLRSVLASKDPCSAPIRRQAIALVARRNTPESVALLGQIARSDAEQSNQLEAVRALGRMSNDEALAVLEQFIRNSNDERVQAEAASVLARSDHARAQAAIQALIERTDVAERIRAAAIASLGTRNVSTQYWQTLYGRVESDELRRAVLQALSRNNTDGAQEFLLGVARNPAESSASRRLALERVRATAPIAELARVMQTADSRSLRLSVVSGVAARKEPEATDLLIEIARTGTDPEVRGAAVRALSQPSRRDDPKVARALQQIIG